MLFMISHLLRVHNERVRILSPLAVGHEIHGLAGGIRPGSRFQSRQVFRRYERRNRLATPAYERN